jgi:hypothetical protein
MHLVLLVLSIIAFVVFAVVALAGGSWDTAAHLDCVLGIGLALFAGAHLPIK